MFRNRKTRTAAVVGGGVGGLAVAIGLGQAGWQVTVFERAASQPETGTGLGIWPAALQALDEFGLGGKAREIGRRQPSGAIRRPDGSRIAIIDVGEVERKQGEPVYLLSRPALLHLLADALPDGVVQYGTAINSALDGYDVVVGADGINSTVRRAVFGEEPGLASAGVIGWRGTVELDIEAGGETWGRGIKFGLTPQEPGCTNWYAVLPASTEDFTELHRQFGAWHDPIPQVLDLIDPATALRHELQYLRALPAYTRENVALLGDAAHAMTPDLGQGACQAIIDAVTLARTLSASDDIESGLRRYDAQRRRPTQRMAAMSVRASKLAQVKRLLPMRNLIVRRALAAGPPK
jgi:2-polyprenyl-6-methoxyphenol hydroxylase-like FAD-dependent oxidoreductase